MLNKLRIEESQVPKMCLDLYREYGTTMAGLKVYTSLLYLSRYD
jgi:putative hydrolase of the HAD superfamily/pyrimidine and pyridine-specific 5'-nucleotidase